jgi:hypothetical protein
MLQKRLVIDDKYTSELPNWVLFVLIKLLKMKAFNNVAIFGI